MLKDLWNAILLDTLFKLLNCCIIIIIIFTNIHAPGQLTQWEVIFFALKWIFSILLKFVNICMFIFDTYECTCHVTASLHKQITK